jgi:hypothetical protein
MDPSIKITYPDPGPQLIRYRSVQIQILRRHCCGHLQKYLSLKIGGKSSIFYLSYEL